MPAGAGQVFALLHDYERRLEWDTLLCEACLTGGHRSAAKGVTSRCVGRAFGGLVAMETRYLSFEPGRVAAVELVNRPWFFEHFAASIRHEDRDHGSEIIYKFRFAARPRWLAWALEPIMLIYLRRETGRRLDALARAVVREAAPI
jgi:hypothetical protein